MPSIRVTYDFAQTGKAPAVTDLHVPAIFATVASGPAVSSTRVVYTTIQTVRYPLPLTRLHGALFFLQYAQRSPVVSQVAEVYPELIGLTYNTVAKPTFSNNIQTNTAGTETRTQYQAYPKWDFTLQYDYLPNEDPTASDFHSLIGFFMARSGGFEDFLFKAPDDYHVEGLDLGVSDGTTTEYDLVRPIGPYREPIGQVKGDSVVVSVTTAEPHNIPGTGPYTVVLDHHTVEAFTSVTGYAQVPSAPGPGQYSVNVGTATLTFNAANAGAAIVANYRYTAQPSTDYFIRYPRTIVFTPSRRSGDHITCSFDFYFVCRFLQDGNEFDQFMNQLWEAGKVELRSQIV